MIYVVMSQQDGHFQALFKILELLEFPWANRLHHIHYGPVIGMKTRGSDPKSFTLLTDVIDFASEEMAKRMDVNQDTPLDAEEAQEANLEGQKRVKKVEDPVQASRELGISAIKIQDLEKYASVLAHLFLG